MIPRFSELERLTDEQLVERYDSAARNTVVGTGFYRDELFRRAQAREAGHVVGLTRQIRWMTLAILVLTVANLVFVAISVLQ